MHEQSIRQHSCLKKMTKEKNSNRSLVLTGSRHYPIPRTGASREGGARPTGGPGRCPEPAPRLPLLARKGQVGATERGPPARPRAAARGHGRRRTSVRARRLPADSWVSLRACASLRSRRGSRGVGEWDRAPRRGSGQGLRRRGLPRGPARALPPDSRPGPRAERPGPGRARERTFASSTPQAGAAPAPRSCRRPPILLGHLSWKRAWAR